MATQQPNQCPRLDGNPDLYGLGIRLGFYAQWLSTLLVSIFRQEEEAFYRVVNLHLQLALFSCLVLLTVQGGDNLYPCEVIISFWLLVGAGAGAGPGTAMATEGNESKRKTSTGKSGGWTVLGTLAMYTALCGYGVWFWFGGMARIEAWSDTTACEEVAWFGRAGMHGPVEDLGKAVSVGGLAACAGLMGRKLWRFLNLNSTTRGNGGNAVEYTPAPTETAAGGAMLVLQPSPGNHLVLQGAGPGRRLTSNNRTRPRPQTDVVMVLLSVAMMILSANSIENLITSNALVGVNDIFAPGQIIPLLVGSVGLSTTLISIFWDQKVLEPRCLCAWKYHLT